NQLQVLAPPARLRNVASIRPQVRRQLGTSQVERGWQNVPKAQQAEMRQQLARTHPVPSGLPAKPAPFVKHQFIAAQPGGANQPRRPANPPAGKAGQPGPVVGEQKPGPPSQKPEVKPAQQGQKPASVPPKPSEPANVAAERQKLEQEKAEAAQQQQ